MGSSVSIRRLLSQFGNGDEAAARAVFERYARRLAALAEKHISQKLAARVDGEDIVQSVFRTFFERSARGEFHIQESVELWQLLVTITLAKVRSEARRHTAEKRDVSAESPTPLGSWLPQVIDTEPGPEEAVALADQIESLLKDLPDQYCNILSLRLAGHSRTDIAAQLNVSRQTVHRSLTILQQRLDRDLPDDVIA